MILPRISSPVSTPGENPALFGARDVRWHRLAALHQDAGDFERRSWALGHLAATE